MVRAGFAYTSGGRRQRWLCRNKVCQLMTINPVLK